MNEIFIYYGKIGKFDPPNFKFSDIAEDADRNGQRAVELFEARLVTLSEARTMIGLETGTAIIAELQGPETPVQKQITKDPVTDDDLKKSDAKAFHPAKPGSPEGSQKGNKREQKINPDVKSVRQ